MKFRIFFNYFVPIIICGALFSVMIVGIFLAPVKKVIPDHDLKYREAYDSGFKQGANFNNKIMEEKPANLVHTLKRSDRVMFIYQCPDCGEQIGLNRSFINDKTRSFVCPSCKANLIITDHTKFKK